MKKYLAISMIALAAACVPPEPVELSQEEQGELSEALRGRSAGAPVACVSQRDLRGNGSVGEGAILFEGQGGVIYVNRPAAGCPIIDQSRTLITRTPNGRLCQGDIVTVVDPVSNFGFGSCGLGEFTPYRRLR